ncbi:MAG: hypothetical protein K0M70_07535, partial [Arenimonas sp.]|uniref:hypothetical protein n=1 Tax=Arenimonas sp. TaxID=1872635 RepID=UPI0025C0A605
MRIRFLASLLLASSSVMAGPVWAQEPPTAETTAAAPAPADVATAAADAAAVTGPGDVGAAAPHPAPRDAQAAGRGAP